MNDPIRELALDALPRPPLYRLADDEGREVFVEAEVGGEAATVGVLFGDEDLAREFSAGAEEHGMQALAGLEPHALSVARKAAGETESNPFPLYLISDERGEAPLITVETDEGEVLVAALFSSREGAHAFRERAAHLDLPEGLGAIEDADGLRRHALVAKRAGSDYAVIDPETGLTEAIPIEELIG